MALIVRPTLGVLCCLLPIRPGFPANVSLELAGEPAPVNLEVLERDRELFVPVSALTVLGWNVHPLDSTERAVQVGNGKRTVRFEEGKAEALVTVVDAEEATSHALAHAPLARERQLYLPVAALEDRGLLGLRVDRDGASLRLNAPAPSLDEVKRWCDALRIGDPGVFHQSGFRIKLSMPGGTALPEDQEFVIATRANADARLQVFVKNEDEPVQALFGADGVLFPDLLGVREKWLETRAWHVQRFGLGTTPGDALVIAVATTAGDPPSRLLDALRGDRGLPGEWSIDALQVTVTER